VLFLLGLVRFAVAPNRTDQLNPFVRDDFNFIDPGLVLGLRWRFGVGLLDAVREADARRAELVARREDVARGLRVEVVEARGRLEAARRAVEVGERLRRQVRGQAFSAVASYALGIGSAGDVLELLGMLARATSELGLALHDHERARVSLLRATGRDLAEPP
jgi:outer membrane protein TolC